MMNERRSECPMGWFLTAKKKTKVGTRKRSMTATAPKGWNPTRTLAGVEALATVALMATVLLGWRFAESYLSDYVHRHEMPKVGIHQIELTQAPPWLSAGLAREIKALAAQNM